MLDQWSKTSPKSKNVQNSEKSSKIVQKFGENRLIDRAKRKFETSLRLSTVRVDFSFPFRFGSVLEWTFVKIEKENWTSPRIAGSVMNWAV